MKEAACYLQNQKNTSTKVLLSSFKLKFVHQNLFSSYSFSKPHSGDKKAISPLQPQGQMFTRWQKLAYGD